MADGRPIKKDLGFTLVEGLVASAIVGVIGTVMLTMFLMNSRLVTDGALNARVQVQYETVIDQIGSKARLAHYICLGTAFTDTISGTTSVTTKTIYLFDVNHDQIAAYSIVGTVLNEAGTPTEAPPATPFKVGISNVTVTSGSTFYVAGSKKSVTLKLSVFSSAASGKDTAFSKREIFACRN